MQFYDINGTLNGAMQKSLMDEVYLKVYQNNWNSGNENCIKLAKKIKCLFPNESLEVYYIAPKSLSEKQIHSKGLVPNKLRNSKKTFKGVIEPKKANIDDDELFDIVVNGSYYFL